jgi:hypothetical protein
MGCIRRGIQPTCLALVLKRPLYFTVTVIHSLCNTVVPSPVNTW